MRWPFAVALALTLVACGSVLSFATVKVRYTAWQDAGAERRSAAQFELARPAAEALQRMSLPSGVQPCPALPEVTRTHYFCWQGSAPIETTTVGLARSLRTVGAQRISAQCLRREWTRPVALRVICELTAQGQTFFVHIGPDLDKVGTTF